LIAVYIVAGFVVLLLAASVIAYFKLAVPAMRNAPALAPEDIPFCRTVVKRGRGYPWVCAQAVKNGRCPCQPCARLQEAKGTRPVG
jgi:hypothetical protein